MSFLLAAANPAGGAATQDIVLATGGAMVLTTFVVVIGVLYRSGKVAWLHKLADFSERQWGVPAWVALAGEISSISLLVALLGMYWDISLHIDQGRDPGPLANPAHYLILFGLFGVFVAGFFAIIMGDHRGGSSMVKRASTWKIPVGGIMLFACASFSLLGFPLDDGWHRIFGQDVTLWGPTHLMLFGGAGATLIGRASLLVEGQRAARREQVKDGDHQPPSAEAVGIPGRRLMNLQKAGLMGGFLIGMSTFQGEFDFGVPQFQMVFHPILIAWAAGIALVTARLWGGRWAALVAVAFFLGVRGLVSIFVGPIMGEVTPHFPLYIVEALLVEGIAFLISTRKPIRFGAWCGVAIGTIGFAAEYAWSHIWMPLPWPSNFIPEGLLWAVVAGVSGGLLGSLIGSALGSDRRPFPWRGAKPALAVGFVAIFLMVGFGLNVNNDPKGASARFQLTNAQAGSDGGRYVNAKVTLDPRSAAGKPNWVTVTAWQGKGKLVVNRLKKVSEGVYQTTQAIPVHGDWKALLRIHKGNAVLGAPIYLPNDPAIPAKGVPAKADVTRPLTSDHKILQRESKSASGILPLLAYLGVLAIALGLCALMAWGLGRLARDGDADSAGPQPETREAWIQRPTGTGAPTPA